MPTWWGKGLQNEYFTTPDKKPKGNFAAPDPMHQKNRNKKEKKKCGRGPAFILLQNKHLLAF